MVFKSGFANDKDYSHLNSAYLPILKAKFWFCLHAKERKTQAQVCAGTFYFLFWRKINSTEP